MSATERGVERSRAHLVAGGAALVAAAAAVLLQVPHPHPHAAAPSNETGAQTATSADDNRAQTAPSAAEISAQTTTGTLDGHRKLASLGPIHAGDVIGDGWRIERIEGSPGEVQIGFSRGGTTLSLGLASPASRTETALVPMPDVYVWYSGRATADPALAALIQALADRLREAAGGEPLFERVMGWSASAPEASP